MPFERTVRFVPMHPKNLRLGQHPCYPRLAVSTPCQPRARVLPPPRPAGGVAAAGGLCEGRAGGGPAAVPQAPWPRLSPPQARARRKAAVMGPWGRGMGALEASPLGPAQVPE